MYAVIAAISLVLSVLVMVFWWTRSARKDGQAQKEAEYNDEVIENVKKVTAARQSITNDERKRLRERYDIK